MVGIPAAAPRCGSGAVTVGIPVAGPCHDFGTAMVISVTAPCRDSDAGMVKVTAPCCDSDAALVEAAPCRDSGAAMMDVAVPHSGPPGAVVVGISVVAHLAHGLSRISPPLRGS